jgi:ribosomal protein S18 acetylase RimI-like enzyme
MSRDSQDRFRPEPELIDENLHEALQVFGRATSIGRVKCDSGLTMISSGLAYGVFNMAVVRGQGLCAHDLADRVQTANRFFENDGLNWSLWLCEERLTSDLRYGYVAVLSSQKLGFLASAPGMIADALKPPLHPLPRLEVRPVKDAVTRREFAFLVSQCFDIPGAFAERVYGAQAAWQGVYQGFVGYANGHAVTCMAIVETPGVVGVYTLGTPAQWRRCGYGEALLRELVEPRLAAHPGLRTVLQASEAGLALYRQLGYRQVSRYGVFLARS